MGPMYIDLDQVPKVFWAGLLHLSALWFPGIFPGSAMNWKRGKFT